MEFPNMKEWWNEDPDKVLSFVYWLQRQVPPTDSDKRKKALKDVADQLDKKHKAPNKKAIKDFVGESSDTLLESYDDFVNEARSESSKIAKRANSDKATVETIQSTLDQLDAKSVAVAVAASTGIKADEVEKILKQMGKTYGGDLQIRIRL